MTRYYERLSIEEVVPNCWWWELMINSFANYRATPARRLSAISGTMRRGTAIASLM